MHPHEATSIQAEAKFQRDPLASADRACEAVPPQTNKPPCLSGFCVDASRAPIFRQGGILRSATLPFPAMGQCQCDRRPTEPLRASLAGLGAWIARNPD